MTFKLVRKTIFEQTYDFSFPGYNEKLGRKNNWLVPQATNLWFRRVGHASVLAQGQQYI